MCNLKSKKILLFCFAIFLRVAVSQTYSFRQFSSDNGLPDPYIFYSFQDKEGFLWCATTKGLVKFDGQVFIDYKINNVDGDFIQYGAAAEDGTLWFGTFNGKIYNYNKETETLIKFSDSIVGSIDQIIVSSDKQSIYFVSKGSGIYILKNDRIRAIRLPEIYQINYAIEFERSSLIIATPEGLYYLDMNNGEAKKIKGSEYDISRIQKIYGRKRKILVSINGNGLMEAELNENISQAVLSEVPYLKSTPATDISNFYLDELNGVLCLGSKDESLHMVNLSDRSVTTFSTEEHKVIVNSILSDKEGNIWISTGGKGLFRFLKQESSMVSFENQPIYSITKDNWNVCYYASDEGIYVADKYNNILKKITHVEGLKLGKVNALFYDGLRLWIGTNSEGLLIIDPTTLKKTKIEFSAVKNISINSITGNRKRKEVYVGTNQEGVFIYKDYLLKHKFSSKNKGLHNNVFYAVSSVGGQIYYATHNSSFSFSKDDKVFDIDLSKRNLSADFNSLAIDKMGILAIGTNGDGVYFWNDTVITPLDLNNQLESKFCNTIAYDTEGNLWIALRYSLYKYYPKEKVLKKIELKTDNDAMFQNNSVYNDESGSMLFGTNRNVISIKNSNTKKSNPVCYLLKVSVFDSLISKEKPLNLKNNKYDFSFEFSALSLLNSEKVNFSYILLGRDNKWSEPSPMRKAEFSNLGEGSYTFKVRAYNSEGFVGREHVVFTFLIDKPFWKKAWFWGIVILLLIGLIFLIVRIRTTSLIHAKVKLERIVEEKTKELREEKQVIEAKNEIIQEQNRDITAGITYAKRIQEAVLPDKNLYEDLKDSMLIYYKPKDIVSGDFYWFAEKEGRFLIATCDCTGHGVPGAFMSMIGSTLLNKIIFDKDESSPEKIIFEMDKEISKSLQQENSDVNDGMEAALCSIDMKTREIYFAGAKRPLMLFRKEENGYKLDEYKADRSPIGGNADIKNKVFTLHKIMAGSGDMAYMFSDGIIDQFNEAKLGRISTKRLRDLLLKLSPLPVWEQHKKIDDFLINWQGKANQTDDILIIGIRL